MPLERRSPLGHLLLAALASCVTGCTAPAAPSVDEFFQTFTDEWVRRDPNQAVGTQYFEGEEQDQLSQQLTPVSTASQRDRVQFAQLGLDALAQFDRDAMTDSQRLSAEVMQRQLQDVVESEPFLDYYFPLQQRNGINVTIPNALAIQHPIQTERDAVNYVARLAQVDDRMAEATTDTARLAEQSTLPLHFILTATIAQMERFVAPPPADNPLVTAFATKMQAVSAISSDRQEALRLEATQLVEAEVYPAWQAAIALLESHLPAATDDAGLWRFESGAALYAQRLRYYTTTDLSAEQIHQIGLDEVSRIEAEMDALLRPLGYVNGSIVERVAQLREALSYPDTDAGRTRIMEDIDVILEDAQRRTAELFDVRPVSPVIARAYPEFLWATAAARYNAPPANGSRPGVFEMPLQPSSACGRLCTTRPCPAITSRLPCSSRTTISQHFAESARSEASQSVPRDGRCMRSALPGRPDGTRTIHRDA